MFKTLNVKNLLKKFKQVSGLLFFMPFHFDLKFLTKYFVNNYFLVFFVENI